MKIVNNKTHLICQEIEPADFDDVTIRGCTMAHVEAMGKSEVFIGLHNDFNDDDVDVGIWISADVLGRLSVRIGR